MPQVKGRATWLANPRQGPNTVKAPGIDESSPKIENEMEEENMRRELDNIQLQAHRALADRTHDLTEARRDVTNYRRIQKLAREKRPDPVAQRHRLTGHKTPAPEEPVPVQKASLGLRPQTSLRTTSKGFSQIQIESDSDDDDYYFRLRNAAACTTSVLVPRTTAHPSRSRKRPNTSHPARSIRQIREELQDEFSSAPTRRDSRVRRPNTTLGFSHPEPTPPSKSGRSFNELRDLAHLDRLNSAGLRNHQLLQRQQRDQRMAVEAQQLQLRLQKFYDRLDSFKRDFSKSTTRSPFLL